MKLLKNISFYIVIGLITTIIGNILKSDFIFTYLKDNIIGLLLTLLAINTATLGLIASKIQDIVIKYPELDFKRTINEMKKSLLEQIVLIATSIFILLINDSKVITYSSLNDICNIILIAIFVYATSILWDTGKAVFVIIDEIQKIDFEKKDNDKKDN